MASHTLFFALLLTLTLANAQDPTCATGIRASSICCAASCGKCGGKGCQSNPGGGASCCRGRIVNAGVSCNDSDPPCLIGAATTTAPPSTTTVAVSTTTATTTTVAGSTTTASTTTVGASATTATSTTISATTTIPATTVPTTTTTIPTGGTWKNIDDDITGDLRERHEACFVMARGKGYLIGGRGNNGMDIFHPKNRTWTKGPEPPTQIHHMQCVVVGAKIYIPTSWFSLRPERENTRMYWFNTRTMKWFSRTGLPEPRRRGGAASVRVGRRIYVVGGNRGGHGPPAQTLGWMDYYDLDTKAWVTGLKDLPVPRDHVGGALVNGQLCIAGGRDGGADNFFAAVESSVFCFDFDLDDWVQKDDIPTPRAGAATERLCDGRMMVAGGEGRRSAAFDTVEIFDGTSWTTAPSLQRARHGTGLAVARKCGCGQIFIASGSGARGGRPELSETEVFLAKGKDRICNRY